MILQRRTQFVLLAAGVLLVSIGGFLNFSSQGLIQDIIHKQFILSENGILFHFWVKNPVSINDRIFFFNWTNPSDLKEPGYKPKFKEVGPYSTEETFEKINIVWNDNGTVTYRKRRNWYFKPETSNGSMSDLITTINPVAVSGAYVTRNWMSFARRPISMVLAGTQQMHVTRTVSELTYNGYRDPVLDAGSMMPGISNLIPIDRFGYFYPMNGSTTTEGVFNVETGANGLDKIGLLYTWDYKNVTRFYDPPCGKVRGTAGELGPPARKKTDEFLFYSTEFCRSIALKYVRTVTVNGIEGYRYEPTPELFDNGTSNPENRCFCSGECVPSGVMNSSLCRFNSPAYVSYPHFLDADPSYRDTIEGMKPDRQKHEIYMVLEPTYGLPLKAVARMQVNLMVQPDPGVSMFEGIPRLFFPVFWVEQKTEFPSNLIVLLKFVLALPTVAYILGIILIVMGIVFLLLFFASWIQTSLNHNRNLPLIIEREVKSPLIKMEPKFEIIPTSKESNI